MHLTRQTMDLYKALCFFFLVVPYKGSLSKLVATGHAHKGNYLENSYYPYSYDTVGYQQNDGYSGITSKQDILASSEAAAVRLQNRYLTQSTEICVNMILFSII